MPSVTCIEDRVAPAILRMSLFTLSALPPVFPILGPTLGDRA